VDLMASALRAASGLTLAMVTSWSLAQPAALPRIGWVISGTPENTRHIVQAIHAGLGDEGLVDGRDVVLDVRFTGGRPERYPELFGELTRQPVAVLAGASHAGISAARDASAGRTPVSAFFCGNDAKAMVESFARPGGNITGVSCFATELATKRVELLKRAVPTLRRIGLLYDSSNPGKEQEFIQVRQAADQLGMSATRAAASSVQDLREAIGSLRRDGAEALIISEDAFTFGNRAAIVALAAEHRLVDISPFREFVQAGGVLSYGANIAERLRAQARYAAKLVRGTKPSELPIDQAMRLELVVNQKAARALGTQIPAAVLARADEVLE
jgi:putative tryptophan/tyrosine transport system substrate-binding protein